MGSYEMLAKMGEVGGIAGLAIGALVLIFRDILRQQIFPKLPKSASHVLTIIVVLTWSIGVLGVAAWTFVKVGPGSPKPANITQTTSGPGSAAVAGVTGSVTINNGGQKEPPP